MGQCEVWISFFSKFCKGFTWFLQVHAQTSNLARNIWNMMLPIQFVINDNSQEFPYSSTFHHRCFPVISCEHISSSELIKRGNQWLAERRRGTELLVNETATYSTEQREQLFTDSSVTHRSLNEEEHNKFYRGIRYRLTSRWGRFKMTTILHITLLN